MTTAGMRAARAADAETWGLRGAANPLAFGCADLVLADADEIKAPASAAYPAFDVAGELVLDAGEFVRQTNRGTGLLPRRQVTYPQELVADWHPANLEVGERNGKVPVTLVLTNRRLIAYAEKFKLPRASRFSLTEIAVEIYLRRMEKPRWTAHVLLESIAGVEVDGDRLRVETLLRTESFHARLQLDFRSGNGALVATEMHQAVKDRWREYGLPEGLQRLVQDVPLAPTFAPPAIRPLGSDTILVSAVARKRLPNLPERVGTSPGAAGETAETGGEESPTPNAGLAAFDFDWPARSS